MVHSDKLRQIRAVNLSNMENFRVVLKLFDLESVRAQKHPIWQGEQQFVHYNPSQSIFPKSYFLKILFSQNPPQPLLLMFLLLDHQ